MRPRERDCSADELYDRSRPVMLSHISTVDDD